MSLHIVDDEQRRDRPQPPCALRVPAPRGDLRRWRSSTMYTDIACVAPPGISPRGARNATPANSRTDSCRGAKWQAKVRLIAGAVGYIHPSLAHYDPRFLPCSLGRRRKVLPRLELGCLSLAIRLLGDWGAARRATVPVARATRAFHAQSLREGID